MLKLWKEKCNRYYDAKGEEKIHSTAGEITPTIRLRATAKLKKVKEDKHIIMLKYY